MEETLNIILVEFLKFAVVGAVGLAVPILIQVLRKAGIQLSGEKIALVNQVALLAAAEVEEWAAKRLKANLPVSGGEKVERAIEQMLAKLPNVTETEAKNALHAALPQIGLGAAAGLREVGKAITSPEPK